MISTYHIHLERDGEEFMDLYFDKSQVAGSMLWKTEHQSVYNLFLGQQVISIKISNDNEFEYFQKVHDDMIYYLSEEK